VTGPAGRCIRNAVVLLSPLAVLPLLASCTPDPPPTRLGVFVPRAERAPDAVAEADELGVDVMRMEQQVGAPLNAPTRTFLRAGKAVVVVSKAGPGTASQPPADLGAYRADLAARLDEYRPPLLAIENEETAENFYAGTADQYLHQLWAAVEVAHGRGVQITNGGIPFVITALATWDDLRKHEGAAAADAYLDEAFDSSSRRLDQLAAGLRGYPSSAGEPYDDPSLSLPASLRTSWRDGEHLFSAYGSDPGDVDIDVVNFHWYVTDEVDDRAGDADALRRTIDFVERTTGKRAVTNEIGQWGRSAEAVTRTLRVVVDQRHLPWVVWFDHDGDPADGLHDYDPDDFVPARDLRPNGRAFRAAVAAT
jgi:hypothetical protein